MQSIQEALDQRNTEILAISVDSPEDNEKVVAKLALSYPILSDPDLEAITAFGVGHEEGMMGKDIARPAVFIIDPEGQVAWKAITDNWRVRVTPERIIEALDSLRQ